MYAIIATGGKQYKVSEGDVIRVEKLGAEAGSSYEFEQVLAVCDEELTIGTPVAVAETSGEFVLVEGKGYRGWVHQKYLTLDAD